MTAESSLNSKSGQSLEMNSLEGLDVVKPGNGNDLQLAQKIGACTLAAVAALALPVESKAAEPLRGHDRYELSEPELSVPRRPHLGTGLEFKVGGGNKLSALQAFGKMTFNQNECNPVCANLVFGVGGNNGVLSAWNSDKGEYTIISAKIGGGISVQIAPQMYFTGLAGAGFGYYMENNTKPADEMQNSRPGLPLAWSSLGLSYALDRSLSMSVSYVPEIIFDPGQKHPANNTTVMLGVGYNLF